MSKLPVVLRFPLTCLANGLKIQHRPAVFPWSLTLIKNMFNNFLYEDAWALGPERRLAGQTCLKRCEMQYKQKKRNKLDFRQQINPAQCGFYSTEQALWRREVSQHVKRSSKQEQMGTNFIKSFNCYTFIIRLSLLLPVNVQIVSVKCIMRVPRKSCH